MNNKGLTKLKIFCIDDDKEEVQLTKECITFLGHLALAASDVNEAIHILKENQQITHKIDMVILDYVLHQGTDGVKVAEEIYKIDSSIPVLLVTRESTNINEIAVLVENKEINLLGICPKRSLDINLESWVDVVEKNQMSSRSDSEKIFKWNFQK